MSDIEPDEEVEVPQDPFLAALMDPCGLNEDAANALIAQGIVGPGNFLAMTEGEIDNLVKHILKSNLPGPNAIRIPFNSVPKLKAFWYWAVVHDHCDMPTEAEDFDYEVMLEMFELIKE